MACWCQCLGNVTLTSLPIGRHNVPRSLPHHHRLGIVCGSGRRASSRKKTTDSASLLINPHPGSNTSAVAGVTSEEEEYVVPKLPGDEPDFWEGPQWDNVGFIMQYLWAFGIVFAVVACGVAVRTYNYGATDFKETPVYKEAIESQGLFEEAPETPDSQIFETNPTQVGPSP